ncbi:hypothetical protein BJ165DRAFT_1410546 [Panaeolus papilionaceus]|nr:hypothetical protein BJ165DRAFT_1410546 [Panaeolus papilionaceus]
MENAAQAAMGTQIRSQAAPSNSKLFVTQPNSLLDSDSLPDKDFFYEPLFLKVSNRLFCIPQEHLDVPGTAFGLMFADGTPSTSPNGTEGSHQGNPIILEGIDLEEFRGFLKAVWRRQDFLLSILELIFTDFGTWPLQKFRDRYPLETEDWKNALGLAIQWEFEEIKIEAQANIFSALNKDPFEMIQLGRKFKIRSWIVRGYSILVDLSFMLSAEEMIDRDMRSELLRIWKIREALRYFSYLANPAALSGLHPQRIAGEQILHGTRKTAVGTLLGAHVAKRCGVIGALV